MSLGYQTQVIRHSSKCLFLLSHPKGPSGPGIFSSEQDTCDEDHHRGGGRWQSCLISSQQHFQSENTTKQFPDQPEHLSKDTIERRARQELHQSHPGKICYWIELASDCLHPLIFLLEHNLKSREFGSDYFFASLNVQGNKVIPGFIFPMKFNIFPRTGVMIDSSLCY